MRFKFILAIALILCLFIILPVNASLVVGEVEEGAYLNAQLTERIDIDYGDSINPNYFSDHNYFTDQTTYNILNSPITSDTVVVIYWYSTYSPVLIYNTKTITINVLNAPPDINDSFDIDIDLHEQIIELGRITNLEQTFEIGSTSERVIQKYTSYASMSCTIDDLQRNYVKIKFDKDYDYAEIFLSGNALLGSTQSEFTTQVKFNYTYISVSELQAFIQTYDYQNGNLLTGVNMSVYEVIENGENLEIGNLIYTSISADSQTILMLKENTDYFIENELTGYYAVKNEEIASLNNRYGYLWTPSLTNPLRLYYNKLEPTAQYNANFIVQDVNNNGIAGVSVIMDNTITKVSNSIGGLSFNNVSAGVHTFTFIKNGYQTAQRTIDIQLQYATFTQTLFADNQIIQPTISPTAYPTIQPTIQPTLTPIDKPTNILESVSYGLAKVFGVKTVDNANYIFALLIILFPAAIAGGITHQALGFIAGGMLGFVFALTIGLVPIWTFFAMCLLAVIYIMLIRGNEGF